MPDAAVAEVESLKSSPEYKRLKTLLSDPEWRLDNLYWIKNEQGDKVKFVRNEAQRAYHAAAERRNLIPKARKLGFSTFIAILITDRCIFRSGNVAGIVDYTLTDATDKLAIVKFAYDNLPADIRAANPLVRANDEYLEWANGSTVSVGTSYRGGTPADLHVSEFGKTSADNPEAAREIETGAIQAVPATGRVWVESTAHGTSGRFCDMVKRAQVRAAEKQPMTALDYKLHFFGWWMKREYRLPNNLVVVPHELQKYFAEQRSKFGIKIDADQAAWYTKKYEELGPDDVKQEFPTNIDELFFVSLEGAFWREEISKARRDGRIGKPVPHDPSRPVNTTWDIGEDCTAIWFHQSDGVRHRFIDYWEEEGSSLQSACGVVEQKRIDRKFIYGTHYGPHDLDNRDWAHESKTRKQTAEGLGIKFEVVPKVMVKADAIEAGRRMIGLSYFCSDYTTPGVGRLENYRKRWNKLLAQFTSDPLHNMDSHGSDSFMNLCMGIKPEKIERGSGGRRERPKRTQWGG